MRKSLIIIRAISKYAYIAIYHNTRNLIKLTKVSRLFQFNTGTIHLIKIMFVI